MRNKFAKVSDPNTFFTSPGETEHIEYSPKVLPNGIIELQPSGKTDINAFIEAQRESTDISYIIAQINAGNLDVLNQAKPLFGDFTEMPKTYAEALQLRIDAEKSFYSLPVEVRNKFDNDFNQYFASAGTEEWFSKVAPVMPADEKTEEGEVTEK